MKRGVAIVLLALSCWMNSPGVADASLAGALAGKAVSKLDDALRAVKNVWVRGAQHADDAGNILRRYGDDLVRLAGKYGDEVSSLTSRNRQRLLHMEGQVDDDLLRQAVRQGDEGMEALYKRVTGMRPVPKSPMGRVWDAVKRIKGVVSASLAAFLGGFGLGFFTDLLGDLPPVLQWFLKVALYGLLALLVLRTLQRVVATLSLTLNPLFRFLWGPQPGPRVNETAPVKSLAENRGSEPRDASANRPEKRSSHKFLVLAILMAALYGLVLASWIARVGVLDRVDLSTLDGAPGKVETEIALVPELTPEERFIAVKARLETEWSETVSRLRKEMKALVAARMNESYGKWVSSERMDKFCDDYFGYVQGWKFVLLGLRDLVKEGSPYSRAEIDRLVQTDLLFDLEDDLNSLYLEIEDRLKTENRKFTEKVANQLQEEFSEEEIASLAERMEFGSLTVLPSEFMAFARTGGAVADFFFSDAIAEKILDWMARRLVWQAGSPAAGALATAAGARKAFVCAGGLARIALGFSIGIVIDYAVSRAVRIATEEDLRAEFTEALGECRKQLLAQWEEGIDSVLGQGS